MRFVVAWVVKAGESCLTSSLFSEGRRALVESGLEAGGIFSLDCWVWLDLMLAYPASTLFSTSKTIKK